MRGWQAAVTSSQLGGPAGVVRGMTPSLGAAGWCAGLRRRLAVEADQSSEVRVGAEALKVRVGSGLIPEARIQSNGLPQIS